MTSNMCPNWVLSDEFVRLNVSDKSVVMVVISLNFPAVETSNLLSCLTIVSWFAFKSAYCSFDWVRSSSILWFNWPISICKRLTVASVSRFNVMYPNRQTETKLLNKTYTSDKSCVTYLSMIGIAILCTRLLSSQFCNSNLQSWKNNNIVEKLYL